MDLFPRPNPLSAVCPATPGQPFQRPLVKARLSPRPGRWSGRAVFLTAVGLAVSAAAQYAPPPPLQPFPGFVNEALRKENPANAKWDVGGSFRMRYEVRENHLSAPGNDDFRKGIDNDNSYFSDKLLLRLGYAEPWWGVMVEGRSSSVTGDQRGSAPNIPQGSSPESDGPVDLHQAFVTLGNLKEFPVSAKVGRQELSYGDERLIGAFVWHNIGRVFDGAKLRYQNEWFGVDGFATRLVVPDDNNFNMASDYEWFSGLYFNTAKIPLTLAEFYLLARNVSPEAASLYAPLATPSPYNTSARDTYTVGARVRSATNALGRWDYTVEAAGQFGDWKRPGTGIRPNERDEQRAMAFSANAGYTFAEAFGKPRLALEYDFATGDSDPNDGRHETFDNLFPTNHKFYGYADLVSWQNIHDVRGIFQLRPHRRVSLALEGHAFWLADTHDRFYNVAGLGRAGAGASGTPGSGSGYGMNPGYDSFVGNELDAICGIALAKFANLELGYAHFFRGGYIKDSLGTGGSQDADWFYAQLSLRF